jgi:hypothetical protein
MYLFSNDTTFNAASVPVEAGPGVERSSLISPPHGRQLRPRYVRRAKRGTRRQYNLERKDIKTS